MDCAVNQESKSAVAVTTSSPSFSLAENNWVDANLSHALLADNSLCINTTPFHNLVELSNSEVHALPISHRVMVEAEAHVLPLSCGGVVEFNSSAAYTLPPSASVPTVVHATNTFALQFGCSPLLGSHVAHSNMHGIHVPSSYSSSTLEGSSLSGNAAAHALCWQHSGNEVSHVTRSPSRLGFMESFVSTLLPELKRIHGQSPPISLKEKLSAVRLAANMSLAISAAGNNTWSQALFQELASCKVGVRRKNNVRKSNIRRGRIFASIMRRSSSSGMRLRSRLHASSSKGSNSYVHCSSLRDCSQKTQGSPANCSRASLTGSGIFGSLPGGSSCCKSSSYVRRMRRVTPKRRSGLFSYVKILRNSRSTRSCRSLKSPADPCNETSKAYTPSISKEHIKNLGRLVPGGRNMDVPLLFQEAADYILTLQMQVEALQSLSHFVSL